MKNCEKRTPISLPEYIAKDPKKVAVAVAEMDGESNGSWTEEVESPRSVAPVETGGGKNIHSQILRIIAEDSRIGEERNSGHHFSHVMVFSRPISPLSGRVN